jgi:hypothetical protein
VQTGEVTRPTSYRYDQSRLPVGVNNIIVSIFIIIANRLGAIAYKYCTCDSLLYILLEDPFFRILQRSHRRIDDRR